MRYHIASLVAVFLALTIGLLLGSMVADTGVLVKRQENIVESIRRDISKMNEENVALQADVRDLRNFQNEVLPAAVRKRLGDRRVAVISMRTGQENTVDNIRKILKTAGAQVFSFSIETGKLNFADKSLVARLGGKFEADDVQGGEFESLFWLRLAIEMAGQQPPDLINELTAMGLVKMDAGALPVNNAVVLAPNDRKAGNRDVLFIEALVKTGAVHVVGVEIGNTKPSRTAAYKLRDVATVDNVETVSGKISLVYLLENPAVTAHFGTKSTADKRLP